MASEKLQTGKGQIGKYNKIEVEDKDKQLVKDIATFNLMLFNKYNGKVKTPEEMQERFSDYFMLCIQNGRIPTVERFGSCFSVMLEVRSLTLIKVSSLLSLQTPLKKLRIILLLLMLNWQVKEKYLHQFIFLEPKIFQV